MAEQCRQGDFLLERVDGALPADAVLQPPDPEGVVLGRGERAGHTHRVVGADAALYAARGGERFLVVSGEAVLRHEEHNPIRLVPGVYKVTRQREWTPPAPKAESAQDWNLVED